MGAACSYAVGAEEHNVMDKRFDTSRKPSAVEESSSFSSHDSADDDLKEEAILKSDLQLAAELPLAAVHDSDEKYHADGDDDDDAEAVRQFTDMVALTKDGDITSLQGLVERRQTTDLSETAHPPLAEATLHLQLGVLHMDWMCADGSSASTSKRTSSLKKSRSVEAELLKKAKKRQFEIKAKYLRNKKKITKRKTGKYGCREFATHIVVIRETLELPLEASDDGQLAGCIEVAVKKIRGRFSKEKIIGYASIPLALYMKAGAIVGSGDSTDLTLKFYAKSSTELKTELSPDGDNGQVVVCHMDAKLKLVWDQKAWNECKLRVAAEQRTSGHVINDPMRLMQMCPAKLKLFVVGAVMTSTTLDSWMRMEGTKMAVTMKRMGTKMGSVLVPDSEDDCGHHIMVKVQRRVHGEDDDMRLGADHASKTDETVFIGEEFVFDISPFYQHKSALSSKSISSSTTRIHPELEYCAFDGGEENPGYFLLTVENTKHGGGRVEHGCALLKISTLLETATLAPGSKQSHEAIFSEPMFQPLTEGTREIQRKQPLLKTGFILCKSRFEWH